MQRDEDSQDIPGTELGNPSPSQLEGGHIDLPFTFEELAEDEAAAYLGDPAVIDAMVRSFLKDAIDSRTAAADGDGDQAPWLASRIEREVRKLLGKANDFVAISDAWNSPSGGIVAMVSARYNVIGAPEAIMAVPFYEIVAAYLEAEADHAKGVDSTHLIDGAIETAVATFLGIDESATGAVPSV